jgi:hypothetical protein
MVVAERNKLLADRAAGAELLLARLHMFDDSLHLAAAKELTVGIGALASMEQRLDTALEMGKLDRLQTSQLH